MSNRLSRRASIAPLRMKITEAAITAYGSGPLVSQMLEFSLGAFELKKS